MASTPRHLTTTRNRSRTSRSGNSHDHHADREPHALRAKAIADRRAVRIWLYGVLVVLMALFLVGGAYAH